MKMKFRCQHCQQYRTNASKLLQTNYHLSGATDLFKRLLGSDTSIRIRENTCENCKYTYQTYQIGEKYVNALVKEVQAKETKTNELIYKIQELEQENQALRKKNKAVEELELENERLTEIFEEYLCGEIPQRKCTQFIVSTQARIMK